MICGILQQLYLLIKGCHAKTIASRLGHADIRTTMNIYGHALQSADKIAADTLNMLLTPRSDTPKNDRVFVKT